MKQFAVSIRNLSKSFSKLKALDKITVDIRRASITGIVGPDGAGKTTFIRHLAGLLKADSGEIDILGFNPKSQSDEIQKIIGYMPQQFGLYEDLSIMENLELYAELKALPKHEKNQRINELLHFTALQPFTKRLAGQLSGGMKQKLGLACAMMTKPRLLLLDEPGVGVDPISRRDLWSMVSDLKNDGVTIIWSTAYLDEAEACDEVLCLEQGQQIFFGKSDALVKNVEGRVFLLEGASSKRALLRQTIGHSFVKDGVIHGLSVRILLNDISNLPLLAATLPENIMVKPEKPRFEDAVIDLLGGIKSRRSALAEAMKYYPPIEKPVIHAESLTKTFGNFTATDHVSFSVRQGEIFGLLGPNGAGKSTTFKMLCGLMKPTSGEGFVNGLNLMRDGSEARAQLGYMAQKFSLYNDLTISENLDFFAGIYGLDKKQIKARRVEMITTFELEKERSRLVKTLPLGLKQRLALAASLMHQPLALFLDEPTSGVDPLTRREFWNHINGLAEKGVTILVTTHFMDEAEYCDRIALIYQGKAIALGSPDSLKKQAAKKDEALPTMEEAFIRLVRCHDSKTQEVAA